MKKTILLVDDDLNLLAGLRRALRKEDFEVLYSTSAEWGLRAMEGSIVDLVISDMRMPGQCGVEFLTAIKDMRPDVVRFILSGHVTGADLEPQLEAGIVHEVFEKPCDPAFLAERIRSWLQKRAAELESDTDPSSVTR